MSRLFSYVFALTLSLTTLSVAQAQTALFGPDLSVGSAGGFFGSASSSGASAEVGVTPRVALGFAVTSGRIESGRTDDENRITSFLVGPVFYASRQSEESPITVAASLATGRVNLPGGDFATPFAVSAALYRDVSSDASDTRVAPHIGAGLLLLRGANDRGTVQNANSQTLSVGLLVGVKPTNGFALFADPTIALAFSDGEREASFGLTLGLAFGYQADLF